MKNVVVLGSGMAAAGAASCLTAHGVAPVLYDKNAYHGGLTASPRDARGFTFDLGPHISFTKDPRIQNLLADSVDQEFETIQINLNNYWRGHWPRHPVQLHLHGLPEDVIVRVIEDFVEERSRPERPINNYADWLLASFGRSFADWFPGQYTRKYHLTTPDNMTTDWLGPRLYRPNLDEVLRGALSPAAPTVHYITNFRYPRRGGFVSYLRKLLPLEHLHLNSEAIGIDPKDRQVRFANGDVARYDELISSVPLPDLIAMIADVPPDVLDASRRLACSTCVLVNLGIDRQDLSAAHVTYFYDDDICFARLCFPHMLSPHNAPPGTGSVQAEVYFSSKYRPLTDSPDAWIDPVIRDLRRCGILRDSDTVLSRSVKLLRYANVIFDLDRPAALQTVHGFLDDVGIAYCGRHGDWGYMWTDESFKSGERAAEQALTRLGSHRTAA